MYIYTKPILFPHLLETMKQLRADTIKDINERRLIVRSEIEQVHRTKERIRQVLLTLSTFGDHPFFTEELRVLKNARSQQKFNLNEMARIQRHSKSLYSAVDSQIQTLEDYIILQAEATRVFLDFLE